MGDYVPVDKFKEYIKKAKTKGQEEAWNFVRRLMFKPESGICYY